MAHLWIRQTCGSEAAWQPCALVSGEENLLFSGELRLLSHRPADGGEEQWALLAPGGVQALVNGELTLGSIRGLADRDEISLASGSETVFLSTERLAVVSDHVGAAAVCPRCKQGITPGAPAVKCPACGMSHHQSEALPCWTYAERCAFCDGRSTALDSSYTWTPAGEDV